MRGTHENALFMQDTRASGIIVNLFRTFHIKSVNEDVPESVAGSDGIVINHGHRRYPSRLRIVSKCEQSVLRSLVHSELNRFLHIPNNDSGPLSGERDNCCCEGLE